MSVRIAILRNAKDANGTDERRSNRDTSNSTNGNFERKKMVKEIILNTRGTYDKAKETDPDGYKLWNSIAEFMHGEKAIINERKHRDTGEIEYVFAGLSDIAKNKELFYLIEQDPMIGIYGDNRTEFDLIWDAGEYVMDGALYLEKEQVKEI